MDDSYRQQWINALLTQIRCRDYIYLGKNRRGVMYFRRTKGQDYINTDALNIIKGEMRYINQRSPHPNIARAVIANVHHRVTII